MAIVVTCICGKSFRAKPELAGKQVACPACGAPLQISQSAPGPFDDPLGLGGFDDRQFAAMPQSPAFTTAAGANTGYAPKKGPSKKSNLPVVLAIVGGACAAGLLVIMILVALLLPAVQAAREAARRVQRENELRSGGDAFRGSDASNLDPYANWVAYRSATGGYSVKLPKPPKVQTRMQPSDAGVTAMQMAVVDLGDDVGAYFVAHNDLPRHLYSREEQLKVLDGSVSGLAGSMNASVTSSRDLVAYGGMARQIDFEANSRGLRLIGTSRIAVVNTRLYQLMWLGPPGQRPREDLEFFFDSFQPPGLDPASETAESAVSIADSPPSAVPSPPGVRLSPPAPPSSPRISMRSSTRNLADLDESERQRIYRRIKSMDRLLNMQRQQIATVEQSGGGSEAMLQRMRQSMEQLESSLTKSVILAFRISEQDIEAIRKEGQQKGWQ